MEIWFFRHFNFIQDSFENRSRGWYARKSLSVWKSYEKIKRKPMATTDAVKDKTCVDQIGFGWSLVCAGLGLAGPRPSKPRASMKTSHVILTIGL